MFEPDFEFEHDDSGAVIPILKSAEGFGLRPDEIWEAVIEAAERLPEDVRGRYIEELTRGLAKRLLHKERSF